MQIQFPIIFMDFYTTLQEQSQSNFTKDMQNLKTRHRNSLERAFVGLFLSSLPSFLFLNPNTPLPTCFSFLLFFFYLLRKRTRHETALQSLYSQLPSSHDIGGNTNQVRSEVMLARRDMAPLCAFSQLSQTIGFQTATQRKLRAQRFSLR